MKAKLEIIQFTKHTRLITKPNHKNIINKALRELGHNGKYSGNDLEMFVVVKPRMNQTAINFLRGRVFPPKSNELKRERRKVIPSYNENIIVGFSGNLATGYFNYYYKEV